MGFPPENLKGTRRSPRGRSFRSFGFWPESSRLLETTGRVAVWLGPRSSSFVAEPGASYQRLQPPGSGEMAGACGTRWVCLLDLVGGKEPLSDGAYLLLGFFMLLHVAS